VRRWWKLLALPVLLVSATGSSCQQLPGEPGGGPTASAVPGIPRSMVALGDSITAGAATCFGTAPCERNSWATGNGHWVTSHYERLRELNPAIDGNAHNLASLGADSSDLPDQAEAAVRFEPEYVTILIGANDACRDSVDEMTDPGTFRQNIDEALDILNEGAPNARILVVSIPDLYRLWEVGHTLAGAVAVWSLGVCPSLLENPESTAAADEARRQQVAERVDAYNAALEASCASHANCRYDGGAVHRFQFEIEHLSGVDYFHPSTAGQDRLSAITWEAGYTWP